jgi:hypothetical protein
MKKIYIAMAQTQEEDRVFGTAHYTYKAAEKAAKDMVKEIEGNTDWKLIPIVEDFDLIEDEE